MKPIGAPSGALIKFTVEDCYGNEGALYVYYCLLHS